MGNNLKRQAGSRIISHIKLTESQVVKLCEMARYLFPEYEKIYFNEVFKYSEYMYHLNHLFFVKKGSSIDDENAVVDTMHWFEFCVTTLSWYLQSEINSVIEDGRQLSLYHRLDKMFHVYGSHMQCDHPVDYLYKKFEQLKQLKSNNK